MLNPSKQMSYLLTATAFLYVVGCASAEHSNQPHWRAPAYVTISSMGWNVRCLGSRVSIPLERENPFYWPDGSEKTYAEFCDQISTSSHIRRRPSD